MTSTSDEIGDPMTDEEFHDQLRQLIRTAEANGVDVAGGWECRNTSPDHSDWDIEITEVQSK